MIIQNAVWIMMLTGVGLVALIFIHILRQAGRPATEAETTRAARTARVLQGWLFSILVIGFVGGSWATLRHFPIPDQHGAIHSDTVVAVEGFMWGWTIEPATVRAGDTVEFQVTSKDVNHNFAIYAPGGNIVAQTQAMPGFTNRLVHVFADPGTYTVQCLEYCGVAHGFMRKTIEVTASKEN